jgi:hypothetical protein
MAGLSSILSSAPFSAHRETNAAHLAHAALVRAVPADEFGAPWIQDDGTGGIVATWSCGMRIAVTDDGSSACVLLPDRLDGRGRVDVRSIRTSDGSAAELVRAWAEAASPDVGGETDRAAPLPNRSLIGLLRDQVVLGPDFDAPLPGFEDEDG